jgi:hypothetical protein
MATYCLPSVICLSLCNGLRYVSLQTLEEKKAFLSEAVTNNYILFLSTIPLMNAVLENDREKESGMMLCSGWKTYKPLV